ncbi:MAG: endonuclease/exonuclease/phosphatase family protein [Streptosporangiaceae bacterium]
MRVMTWNLWGRFGPWRTRAEAIAATMAEVQPDVCGLQEVWSAGERNFAADLAERLGPQWRWAMSTPTPTRQDPEVGGGNAILSRWPILGVAQMPLPVPDDDPGGRVALHARIETPGGVLPMFTTHLTHHPYASQNRVEQVRRLAEFVAKHTAGPEHRASPEDASDNDSDYPPVLTGDLNAAPDSDEIRLLSGMLTAPAVARQVLVDAWRYASPADPGFTVDRRNGHRTAQTGPDARIDYILAGLLPRRGRGRVRTVRLAGNAPVNGMWPSDHFAVVADLG